MDTESEIERTELMLIDYRALYTARHPRRANPPPFPICGHDVIHQVLDLIIRICPRIRLLLQEKHNDCAAILARPCLEWGLRLLWCRTQPDGWQRLVSYLAAETVRGIEEETKATGQSPVSDEAMAALRLAKSKSSGKLPSIPNMLQDIQQKQDLDRVRSSVAETYGIFFKGSLHQVAHANLTFMAFDHPNSDKYRVARAIRRAALWVLNASHEYVGMSPDDLAAFVQKYIEGFSLPNIGQQGHL